MYLYGLLIFHNSIIVLPSLFIKVVDKLFSYFTFKLFESVLLELVYQITKKKKIKISFSETHINFHCENCRIVRIIRQPIDFSTTL